MLRFADAGMSIDPDFNRWRYLVTVAKVTASLVLVIVPAG